LLACSSQVWLLDEVENNLDSISRQLLTNLLISKANNGGIIIASSHTETLIDSALIIDLASTS
jgi:heme exporter protein A